MNIGTARRAAREWVMAYGNRVPGYQGAYFAGSTVGLPDDARLPSASDIDIVVAVTDDEAPMKLGKFIYNGVLLEVTYLSVNQLSSAEEVLSSYHLAGSFRVNTIINDPSGYLSELQARVARFFFRKEWVERRCRNVRRKIEDGLRTVDTSAPFHDRVTGWLFPTGITTHLMLVAALRNPTVRLRYLAARSVLSDYGYIAIYEELLELLGCSELAPERAMCHLDGLAETFDAAAAIARTPFPFSSDITSASRTVVIDGSRELIKTGYHREAVFWIIASYARCHKILAADAPPDLQHRLMPVFEAAVADLGIRSIDDLAERGGRVIRFLPTLWSTAEAIIAANPEIIG